MIQGGGYLKTRVLVYTQVVQVNYIFNYGSWDSIVLIIVTLLPHDEVKAWEMLVAFILIQGYCTAMPFLCKSMLFWLFPSQVAYLQAFSPIKSCWSIRHLLTLILTTIGIVCYVVFFGKHRVERRKKKLLLYRANWQSPDD
jgi:hypothetical protein